MRRLIDRLLIVGTTLGGAVYGERLMRHVQATFARLDPAHLHGVEITGSPLGLTQAAIASVVILFAVVPAILSGLRMLSGHKAPVRLVVGELVAALLLFGASERVLHESVRAHIVGTGDARVLAVQASAIQAAAPTEAVE